MSLERFNVKSLTDALLGVCGLPENEAGHALVADTVFYTTGEKPWNSTLDLIQLYASNLLNSQLRGPRADRFGRMTRWAIEQAGFVEAGALTRFSRAEFSRNAAEHARKFPLVDSKRIDYTAILEALGTGELAPDRKKTIVKLVASIEQFCKYLLVHHGGSAESFSAPFEGCVKGVDAVSRSLDAARFRLRLIKELDFLLMGPAIAPNFLKDSQIGRARNIANLSDTYIGTLAKPDIHVMRLMLVITGRLVIRGETAAQQIGELTSLSNQDLCKIYMSHEPSSNWATWPSSVEGENRCLHDLNYLAFVNRDPGIVIDRILYTVGAEFDAPTPIKQYKPRDKVLRYQMFLSRLNLVLS